MITLKDFKTKELIGTTHSSADTSRKFRHSAGQVPFMVIPVEGDTYIPTGGIGPDEIDVRSRRTSETFKLLLFFY